MNKTENAAAFMTRIANDASHGYDQLYDGARRETMTVVRW